MAGHGIGRLALAATMTLGLAGCEEGANPFAGQPAAEGGAVAVRAPAGGPAASRDIEAPEVFSMTGEGLWDGRPSLGGIWVAHASVTNPERVLIRNPKNGKSVVGALFRRERLNPGPSIQISSDAADALGLLAGQPAGLSIVALRREELPAPAAEEEAPPAGAAAVTTGTAGAAAVGATRPQARPAVAASTAPTPAATAPAVDPIAASAAAAIAKAEGGADAATAETGAAETGGAETGGAETGAAAAPGLTWAERRAQKRAERLAAREARAAERAAAEAAAAEPAVTVTVTPGPGAAGSGAVSSSVLPAAGAAAAGASAAGEAAAGAAAAPPAPADTLLRAYVQIGIFSTEANAATAAAQLKASGLTATLREDVIDAKPYWRVIVGPAASVAERDALAARVKAIGYPDAYPVQN